MTVPRRRIVATALAGLLLLAGCTVGPSSRPDLAVYGGTLAPATTSSTTRPVGPGGPGQQADLSPAWHPCSSTNTAPDFDISCAGMSVPLDYAHPRTGSVTIDVGRATRTGLPADTPLLVVLLNNGPYDANLATVSRIATVAAALPAEITAKYQIIGMDVRGAGSSNRLNCFVDTPTEYLFTLDADLTTVAAKAQLTRVTRAFTFGCQDYVGPEAVNFGTTQVADDLDSLRSALGLDTLNMVGVGYGATLGAVYADRYPGRVGRFVLDSPTDHSVGPAERAVASAAAYERSLQTFLASCTAAGNCVLGTDPAATLTKALAGLRYDPNSTTASSDVNSGTLLWMLVLGLPDRTRWDDMSAAIAGVAAGSDAKLISMMETLQKDPSTQLTTQLSARLLLACNDSDERLAETELVTRLADAKVAAPTFGSFLVGVSSLCRQWASPEAPIAAVHARGAAPLLVVGGVNDPAAPYGGVQTVASQLSSATLISYQGSDHGGYLRSSCISGAVDGFLLGGAMPAADTLCPA